MAFAEDIGDGDHTTLCCIPDTAMGKSRLLIKEPGILAGVEIARKIFHRFDPDLKMTVYIEDGTAVKPGDVAFVVEGRVQSLLQTERLMLNVMQRMSGIATMTHRYVKKLEGLHTRILDTTGKIHMIIFQQNHVEQSDTMIHATTYLHSLFFEHTHARSCLAGIENAISRCHDYLKAKGKDLKIEIEVRNLDELKEVMRVGGVDRIMLDNFSPELTREAVKIVGGKYEIESSGGITFDTIRDYAESGVDFVSVGALTHSVKGLDMSFKAC